jgi:hypothetical protein
VPRGIVGRESLGQAAGDEPCERVTTDSKAWLKFLRKETGLLRPLLRRKIRIRGRISLLPAFGRRFP